MLYFCNWTLAHLELLSSSHWLLKHHHGYQCSTYEGTHKDHPLFHNECGTMNVSHPVEHQVKCADVYFIEIMYEESGRQGGFQEKQADHCNPNMQKC